MSNIYHIFTENASGSFYEAGDGKVAHPVRDEEGLLRCVVVFDPAANPTQGVAIDNSLYSGISDATPISGARLEVVKRAYECRKSQIALLH